MTASDFNLERIVDLVWIWSAVVLVLATLGSLVWVGYLLTR